MRLPVLDAEQARCIVCAEAESSRHINVCQGVGLAVQRRQNRHLGVQADVFAALRGLLLQRLGALRQ